MKVYLAGVLEYSALLFESGYRRKLASFHYRKDFENSVKAWTRWSRQEKGREKKLDIFLDSGAYSAFTKGVTVSLDDYIAFIHRHSALLTTYSNLDVIGDPAATWENQLEMERQGLQPLPCFHYGEDRVWLTQYMDSYDHFALGGMVPIATAQLIPWLDALMKTLCDKAGRPLRQFHGFGLTGFGLLLRYPWYSVDSSSWMVAGRFGSIYLWANGKIDPIAVSEKSPNRQIIGRHLSTLSTIERKTVLAEIVQRGFALEDIATHYVKRFAWNVRFFCELEERLAGHRRFLPTAGQQDFFA